MNLSGNVSRTLAIILIISALIGTEISYHFTLESRFEAIEQKLQQDTLALKGVQDSLDALSSTKTATLAGLNKQVADLQTSVGPLGKATHDQTDTVTQLRQQIATLQQAQKDQQDSDKKLSAYIAQVEQNLNKVKSEKVAAAPVSAPAVAPTPAPAAASAPATAEPSDETTPIATPKATSAAIRPPSAHFSTTTVVNTAPRATAVNLRSDDEETGLPSPGMIASRQTDNDDTDTSRSLRALPVSGSIAR